MGRLRSRHQGQSLVLLAFVIGVAVLLLLVVHEYGATMRARQRVIHALDAATTAAVTTITSATYVGDDPTLTLDPAYRQFRQVYREQLDHSAAIWVQSPTQIADTTTLYYLTDGDCFGAPVVGDGLCIRTTVLIRSVWRGTVPLTLVKFVQLNRAP